MYYNTYVESKINTNEHFYGTETFTDIENRFVVVKGERGEGKDWEFGIRRYKLLYIGFI